VSEPPGDKAAKITKHVKKFAVLLLAQCAATGKYARMTDKVNFWAPGFAVAAACVANICSIDRDTAKNSLRK
jgi:hypothetical protein